MRQSDDARLARLEVAVQAIGLAWASGDMATARDILSPSYTHNDVFGVQWSRSEWLAYAAKREGRATQVRFRDVQTRLFGDIAILTGFNEITGTGVIADGEHRVFAHQKSFARNPCLHNQLLLLTSQFWIKRFV